MAAERIVAPIGQHRIRALLRIMLGQIAALQDQPERADARWREAASIARSLMAFGTGSSLASEALLVRIEM